MVFISLLGTKDLKKSSMILEREVRVKTLRDKLGQRTMASP
jgi:hypothetical protein